MSATGEGSKSGSKFGSNLPTDSTKNMGERGVKNPEKLPTSFMDGL